MSTSKPSTPATSQVGGAKSNAPTSEEIQQYITSQINLQIEEIKSRNHFGEAHRDLKVPKPDSYSGRRSELKAFLLQVDLYLGFNYRKFANEAEQILWVVTLLRGQALDWVDGYVKDYMTNHVDGAVTNKMDDATKELFQSMDGFKEKMRQVFGAIDEEKEAARQIQNIRQKGSAAKYTAEFQQYSVKTGWDDEALKYHYYRGLKDHVKDDLVREEETDDLKELIELAIKIDNRHFERTLEKKGYYEKKYSPGKKTYQRDSYGTTPMELDATLDPQEKDRRKHERLCYECGKPGHMARDCRAKKTSGQRGSRFARKQQIYATTQGPPKQLCMMDSSLPEDDWDWLNEYDNLAETVRDISILARGDSEEREQAAQRIQLRQEHHEPESSSTAKDSTTTSEGTCTCEEPEKRCWECGEAMPHLKVEIVDKEQSGSDSDIPEEWTRNQQYRYQITAGQVTAKEIHREEEKRWLQQVKTYKIAHSLNPYIRYRGLYTACQEYTDTLKEIDDCIGNHLQDLNMAVSLGIARSQQYQDRIAANIDYVPTLDKEIRRLEDLTNELNSESRRLQKECDANRIDHPQHAILTWTVCYHDQCRVHYGAKEGSGRFPRRRETVYMNSEQPTPLEAQLTTKLDGPKN